MARADVVPMLALYGAVLAVVLGLAIAIVERHVR